MTAPARMRMAAAERIAEELTDRSPAIDAVCVYGSVARGDAGADSDIDVLVVGSQALASRTVRNFVPAELRSLRPVVTFYTWRDLEAMLSARTSFAAHLAKEGRILFDRTGALRTTLDAHADEALAVDAELQHQLRRLLALEDTSQFNGNFLFCLAQLYVVGKAVVMLRLAAQGTPEYNKDRAFRALSATRPELAEDLELVASLRPFYQRITRRGEMSLPFSYRDAGPRIPGLIQAIRRIGGLR